MAAIRYTLVAILSLFLCLGKAQGEIEVDWAIYAKDTVMPVYVHSVDLGYDCDGAYDATIEYPELKPLTATEVERFRLPKRNGVPEWPEISVYKGVSAKRGQLDICFTPIIWRDGKYWRIHSFTLKIHREALSRSMRVTTRTQRYASHSVLAAGRWVKIRVSDNGIHMLTHELLKGMGFENPGKVRLYGYGGHLLSESDAESWRDDLCEVPLWRETDRLLFYANGPVSWTLNADNTFSHIRNSYTDYAYYFLTEDENIAPMEFPVLRASAEQHCDTVATTPAYALYEVDDYAWYHGGRNLVDSYGFANGSLRHYALSTRSVYTSDKGKLEVCFTHDASVSTALVVSANGSEVGAMQLNPVAKDCEASSLTSSFVIPLENRSEGQDVVLTYGCPMGVTGRLDYLRLSYTSTIGLSTPIYAVSEGLKTYEVDATDENTVVWRVTDASSPVRMNATRKKAKLYFTDRGNRGDLYIALDPHASYPIPEEVGEVVNQDLHATGPTDYVIIVPESGAFIAQAERLAEAHRQHRGLTVKIVRADEVYNEFSSGTPDATAYRRYLKMLYDRAATIDDAPKYLLLFGDGAWDNRMLTSNWKGMSPSDYLLCYEVEDSYSTTSSHVVEDYFGLLDDGEGADLKRDKVDVGVGRFPVTTVSQARAVVDKILAYMGNTHAGSWKNTILMLGDDGDKNRHMGDAEYVAQMLESDYPDYMVKRIYWDAFPIERNATKNSYPAARKRLLELLKEGALMVNYSGHGAPYVLSHEAVINKADMAQISSPRLPVWVTASCDITPFDNTETSFGEAALLNPNGGAIGLLSSTRTTYAEQNKRVNYLFSKYTFARDDNNRRLSLGDALRMAKCGLITTGEAALRDVSGNKLNYVLIGDPALVVGNADYRMVIDELNGMPVDASGGMMLKAGALVKVKGHVADWDGTLATNFSGLLYASVFDNIEEVSCRNNENADVDPFSYKERTKKLFVGSDSIKDGKFSFTFRIPLDINYSQESGLINLYAVDSTYTREAKGAFDGFLLGGTEENMDDDGDGPKIQLYLNAPGFTSGSKVNETPRLVAILEDADGINTAGNLGHNIVAIIDGKASMTYVLNEYYTSDIGEYTRGMISYVLPELSEGKHSLMLRAWDMMNNSSTVIVEFEVVKGLSPNILHVTAMPSPAREYITFMLEHDRPESEMIVTFEVFDFSGRILWNHSEQVTSPDNTYTYTWNLRGASGQSLETGMYLYRVIVSSPLGQSESQAQKILIKRR